MRKGLFKDTIYDKGVEGTLRYYDLETNKFIRDEDDTAYNIFIEKINNRYLSVLGIFDGQIRGLLTDIDVINCDLMYYNAVSDKWYKTFVPEDDWTPKSFLDALLACQDGDEFMKAVVEVAKNESSVS